MAINTKVIEKYTEQIEKLNSTLNNYIYMSIMQSLSYKSINKRNEIIQNLFASYISPQIEQITDSIRNNVITSFHDQYSEALSVIEVLKPIVTASISDPGDVVGWAKNIINYLNGPYVQALRATAELIETAAFLGDSLINLKGSISNYRNNLPSAVKDLIDINTLPNLDLNIQAITADDIINGL